MIIATLNMLKKTLNQKKNKTFIQKTANQNKYYLKHNKI